MPERLLRDAGSHFPAKPSAERGLVQDERPARFPHRRQRRLHVPGRKRPQVHHFQFIPLGGPRFGGLQSPRYPAAPTDQRSRRALPRDAGLPERDVVRRIGDRPLERAIQTLVFEKKHGIRVPDRPRQQSLGVAGRGRKRHFQAGNMTKPGLAGLRMERPRANSAPDGRPNRYRQGLTPPVMGRGQVIDDLVEPASDKIRVLYFEDRAKPLDRKAHAGAHRPAFYNGRIADAIRAKRLQKPLRHLEYAPVFGNVLSQQQYGIVRLHRLPQPLRNRIDVPLCRGGVPVRGGQGRARGGRRRKYPGPLRLQRTFRRGLGQRILDVFFDLSGNAPLRGPQFRFGSVSGVQRPPRKPRHRIARGPRRKERIGDVGRAGRFLVPPHSKRFHFQKGRAVAAARPIRRPPHGPHHLKYVVSVHHCAGHAVPGRRVGYVLDGHGLLHRRRKAVAIVFDHEKHRQFPQTRQARRFVKISLAGAPVSRETQRHEPRIAQLRSQPQPARYRQHGRHVRNHPHDALRRQSEMIRPVAPPGKPPVATHKLTKKLSQGYAARRPDARIPMHGKHIVPLLKRQRAPGGDGFLPVSAEPFRNAPLPDEPKHLFLDGPRNVQALVNRQQVVRVRSRLFHAGHRPLPSIAVRIVRNRILKSMRRLTFSI